MTTPTRRRRRGITSNLNALRAEPALHLRLNLLEILRCASLEPHDEHRPGVGSADQPPPIAEEHTNSIDCDDLMPGAEVPLCLLDDSEFLVVCTIDSDLGRGYKPWHIGQKIADALSRICDDAA